MLYNYSLHEEGLPASIKGCNLALKLKETVRLTTRGNIYSPLAQLVERVSTKLIKIRPVNSPFTGLFFRHSDVLQAWREMTITLLAPCRFYDFRDFRNISTRFCTTKEARFCGGHGQARPLFIPTIGVTPRPLQSQLVSDRWD